jgi:hypothetical protein
MPLSTIEGILDLSNRMQRALESGHKVGMPELLNQAFA